MCDLASFLWLSVVSVCSRSQPLCRHFLFGTGFTELSQGLFQVESLRSAWIRMALCFLSVSDVYKRQAFIGSGVFLPTVLTADHVGVPTRRYFLGRHNLESLLKQENGRKAYAGSAFILQGIPRSVNGKRRNNRKFTNFPLIFPSPHPTCRRVPPTRMPP